MFSQPYSDLTWKGEDRKAYPTLLCLAFFPQKYRKMFILRRPDIPLHGPIRYPQRVPRDELAPELTKDTTTISLQSCKTRFSVEIHIRAKISMFTKQFYFGRSAGRIVLN